MSAETPRRSLLVVQLRWLVALRIVVLSSMLVLHFLLLITVDAELKLPSFYWLAGLGYSVNLLFLVLLQLVPGRPVAQAYLQFVVDLLLITYLVYQFGTPFLSLYLVVIAVASALLRRRAGKTVAELAWILFAGLTIGQYFGWLPISQVAGAVAPSAYRLIYNLFSSLIGFYGLAFLTSYLASTVTRTEERLIAASTDLAELELLHRDIIQSIGSGIITTDTFGLVSSVNRAAEEILGRREASLLRQPFESSDLLSAEQWKDLRQQSQAGGRIRDEVVFDRGGESLYIGFSINQLLDSRGEPRGFIVIFQDLTEWRLLQEELRLKDRMAALGELAASIAHEIGNPLAAISGSVQMLSGAREKPASQARLLDIILHESQRLDRTIKGFLRYARPRERSSIRFDIARLLQENVELLRNSEEVGEHHSISVELAPERAELVGDPDQISQIFWNLARNALRSMPEGGALTVNGSVRPEGYEISILDTGCGMTKAQQNRLFHPFQSFSRGGTGIGMAIVYRLVSEHGGTISVKSRPGAGTAVQVLLPRTNEHSLGAAAEGGV